MLALCVNMMTIKPLCQRAEVLMGISSISEWRISFEQASIDLSEIKILEEETRDNKIQIQQLHYKINSTGLQPKSSFTKFTMQFNSNSTHCLSLKMSDFTWEHHQWRAVTDSVWEKVSCVHKCWVVFFFFKNQWKPVTAWEVGNQSKMLSLETCSKVVICRKKKMTNWCWLCAALIPLISVFPCWICPLWYCHWDLLTIHTVASVG